VIFCELLEGAPFEEVEAVPCAGAELWHWGSVGEIQLERAGGERPCAPFVKGTVCVTHAQQCSRFQPGESGRRWRSWSTLFAFLGFMSDL